MEIKHWLKNIGMRVVKNGCGKSGHMTQKSTVSQERINGINWFLVCWWKFRKAWSYVNKFWMLVFKNGCGLLGLFGSLKSVSREWMNEMSWFFSCWYKFRKVKSYFNNYWEVMVKNVQGLIDHGTLESCISQMIWWIGQIDWMICACWYWWKE